MHGWIHISRTGILAERLVTPKIKKENIHTLTGVKCSDIIRFIVSSENGTNSDSFD